MMPGINHYPGGQNRSIMNMNSPVTPPTVTKRRHSNRHRAITKEDLACSQQSVLTAMDRFVKSVNNMSSTVLVPSKLRDMDVPSTTGLPAPLTSNNGLYHFYNMFKDVKNELLWGPGTGESAMMIASSAGSIGYSGRSSPKEPSSLTSLASDMNESLNSFHSSNSTRSTGASSSLRSSSPGSSAASSSNNSDDCESSSGDLDSISTESSVDEETSRLAATFRHHLQGLHAILSQLADSADYLSNRYQEEVEASSSWNWERNKILDRTHTTRLTARRFHLYISPHNSRKKTNEQTNNPIKSPTSSSHPFKLVAQIITTSLI